MKNAPNTKELMQKAQDCMEKQKFFEAEKLYKQAAESGDTQAMEALGDLYYDGFLNGDYKWKCARPYADYLKATGETETPKRLFMLSVCYLNGEGVAKNVKKAIELITAGAEQGDARCQNLLGWYYTSNNFWGVLHMPDLWNAFKLFSRAAEQGYVKAYYSLGCLYDNKKFEGNSYTESVKYYRLAAEQGHTGAMTDLGYCYSLGLGVEQNYQMDVHWTSKAKEKGDAGAINNLAVSLSKGNGIRQDDKEAVKLFQEAFEKGEKKAAPCNLAFYYLQGIIVEKNVTKAISLYFVSANEGWAKAQYKLGNFYYFGNYLEKNQKEAVQWYAKAAEQDFPEAQNALGVCYATGTGVAKDDKRAAQWFFKAAEQGFDAAKDSLNTLFKQKRAEPYAFYQEQAKLNESEANVQLGDCYANGVGLEQNFAHAFELYWKSNALASGLYKSARILIQGYIVWEATPQEVRDAYATCSQFVEDALLRCAQQRHREAAFELAKAYHYGWGEIKPQIPKALEYYALAAKLGNSQAAYVLGQAYLQGDMGVAVDVKNAVRNLEIASVSGYAPASLSLGKIYWDGVAEIEQDKAHAKEYFEKALKGGMEEARYYLDLLEKEAAVLRYEEADDVFISWNHRDRKWMESVFNDLQLRAVEEQTGKRKGKRLRGSLFVWQSDKKCTGEILNCCKTAVQSANAWVVLISKKSLIYSKWIPKEIAWMFEVCEKNPELKKCIIPVYKNKAAYRATKRLAEDEPRLIYSKLIELGAIYSLKRAKTDLLPLVQKALCDRKIIEYRENMQLQNAKFDAFIANSIKTKTRTGSTSWKLELQGAESVCLPRRITCDGTGETLDMEAFFARAEASKAVFLYGEGGTGKSLLLSDFVLRYFNKNRMVFKLNAKDVAVYLRENPSATPFEYMVEVVNGDVGYQITPELLEGVLKTQENNVFVIVDALDELGNSTLKKTVLKAIYSDRALIERQNVHFIFTARSKADIPEIDVAEKDTFNLNALTREEGEQLAKNVYRYFLHSRVRKNEDAKELLFLEQTDDSALTNELAKLSDEIITNPLLVTNFTILFIDHLLNGTPLPKNRFGIAQSSFLLLVRDVEEDRGAFFNLTEEVARSVESALYHLAYARAKGDTRSTADIFEEYIRNVLNITAGAETLAARLETYLRCRAIIGGGDKDGNVCKTLFQNYLTAKEFYGKIYKKGERKAVDCVDFKADGKDFLRSANKEYFALACSPWDVVVPFMLANLDEQIFALLKVKTDENGKKEKLSLQHKNASYNTLNNTLDILYEDDNNKQRKDYGTVLAMAEKGDLFNADAFKTIMLRIEQGK